MEQSYLDELKKISTSRDDSGLPIYHRMIECMSQMISDGRIADSTHLAPDTQVAAELNISHITWAKVLNELKKRGMVERSRQRGTFIRRPVRKAAAGNLGEMIAVFMDDINTRHINMDFMDTIQSQLASAGYRTMFISAAESSHMQYNQVVNTMKLEGCRGGLIWSMLDDCQTDGVLEQLPSDWPLIFMDGNKDTDKKQKYDLIRFDVEGITESVIGQFLSSGGEEIICLVHERHMVLSFFTMAKVIKRKLVEAGLSVKKLKIVRCNDSFTDVEQFIDRNKNSLLIAFGHKEIGLLKNALAKKSLSEERLLPAIGFSASGVPEQYSWSLPEHCYDTIEFVSQAVQCLMQRIDNPSAPYKFILVGGSTKNGQEPFVN
jgi:DNA-binding LacI/PurR family transcriptional regulator